MKLLLLLSHSGLLSRRKAFEAICAGYVIVNGSVQKEPSTNVDESRDRVEYSGKLIQVRKFEYVVLNKPRGYVSTCEGQFDQEVVMSLLPKELQHLRPVGRLDKETEGLLLFTNDGELANRLMHPSFDVEKIYFARVRGRVLPRAVEKLQNGIQIEGEMTAPARVRIIVAEENQTELEIAIHEGRKHQVRLMCQAVGHHVVTLRRLQQGPIVLGALPPGQWRHLSYEEVGALKAIRPVRPGASDDAPPELDRRFLKPLFSTTSEKRRFSTTRSWNSENDVHAPEAPPKFESAKRPEYMDRREGGRDERRPPRRDDRRGSRPEGRPPYKRDDRPAPSREGRPEYRRDESRGPKPEGHSPYRRDERPAPAAGEARPAVRAGYRRDGSRGPRYEAKTEGRPPYRRDDRSAPSREGRPAGRPEYRRDDSRGSRPEGSRPPYRRDDSRGPRSEGRSAPSREGRPAGRSDGRPPYRRDDRPAGRSEGRPAGASYRPRESKPGETRRPYPGKKPYSSAGKKPYGSGAGKPFASSGTKPFGSAGKKPYSGAGKKSFGPPGSKPYSSAGRKPYGAAGKKPFGASRGPRKFGPPSGGPARPPRA